MAAFWLWLKMQELWLKMQEQNASAWLAAHPKVVTFLGGLEKAVLIAAGTYVVANVKADSATPSTFTFAGLGYAVALAAKLYAQNAVNAFVLSVVGTTPAQALAAKRAAQGGSMKQILLLALLGSLLVGQALAWDNVPGNAFPIKRDISRLGIAVPGAGVVETDLVLMPTASLGIVVGPQGDPSYGYNGGFDLVAADISAGSQNGTVDMVPILGIGAAGYLDLAPCFTNQLPVAYFGINAIGPQIEGLVPQGEVVWNLTNNERKIGGGLTAPFGLFSGNAITKVAQLH